MEDFSAIPVFVAVVETGGISKAAVKLKITKSAVSKRIAQLENRLGTRLLHRTTRTLALTESGERYFDFAKQALIAAENAEHAVVQLQGAPRGQLRIQAPMSFGLLHIADLVPDFLLQYKDINIDLILDDKPLDLIEHNIDLAIRAGDMLDSNYIGRPLAPLHSVTCAAPEYIKNFGLPKSPTELTDHNCLLFSYSPQQNHWAYFKNNEQFNVDVSGNLQVNSSEALKMALLKGLGVARLPSFVAGELIRQGRLVNLFPDYRMPNKQLFALYPERQYMLKKVRVFLNFTIEIFGCDKPYWDLGINEKY